MRAFRSVYSAAFTVALLTSCGCGSDDTMSARDVCGGLSAIAARSLEKTTGSKEFRMTSDGAPKKVARELAADFGEASDAETHELCHVTRHGKGKEVSEATVRFRVARRVPPPANENLVGPRNFPLALRAIGYTREADLYFACRTGAAKEDAPIVHGRLSYDFMGAIGEDASAEDTMKLLQDVSHTMAKRLRCRNAGDIPMP